MNTPIAVSARQIALDQIHAVAIRLRRDRGLAWVGELAPRMLAMHQCVGMTEVEVIDGLVRELLARKQSRWEPPAARFVAASRSLAVSPRVSTDMIGP